VVGVPNLAMGSIIAVHVWRPASVATVICWRSQLDPQGYSRMRRCGWARLRRHFFQVTLL